MRSEGKLLIFTIGLYVTYLNWAYIQERLSSTDYSNATRKNQNNDEEIILHTEARWTYVIVLSYCMAAMCCVISLPLVLLGTGEDAPTKAKLQKRIQPDIPLVVPALSQTLASTFGFLSLQYINYPMLLLAKSSKLMPVMFISFFINGKKYSTTQIGSVVLISVGIALFSCIIHPITLIFNANNIDVLNRQQNYEVNFPFIQFLIGFSLVCINLLMDGFTNAYQDKYRQSHPDKSPFHMMYHINLWQSIFFSFYLLLVSIISRIAPTRLHISSELDEAFLFMTQYPAVVNDIIWFSLYGAAGQIFIFNIIISFGSLMCVKICLTRKFFSILISIVIFGHTVRWWQYVGITIVFGGLLLNIVDTYRSDKTVLSKTQQSKIL